MSYVVFDKVSAGTRVFYTELSFVIGKDFYVRRKEKSIKCQDLLVLHYYVAVA